jgi:hypothetical protein
LMTSSPDIPTAECLHMIHSLFPSHSFCHLQEDQNKPIFNYVPWMN